MPNPTAMGITLGKVIANLSAVKPPPRQVRIYIRAPVVKVKSEIVISDAFLIKGRLV